MTDALENKLSLLSFGGAESDWYMWSRKFLAKAEMNGYGESLRVDLATSLDTKKKELNDKAFYYMQLACMDEVSFSCVDLADKSAFKAWKNLEEKYEPKTGASRIQLQKDFHASSLASDEDPDKWFTGWRKLEDF